MPLTPIDSWIRPQDESFSLAQGTTQRITVADLIGNDTGLGGAVISLVSVAQPTHGSLALQADGSYLYIPKAGYVGPDSFSYVVGDQFGNTCTEGVEVTVTPALANQAPRVQDEYVDVYAGVPVSAHESLLLANDSDADGGTLSVANYSQPAHGTLNRAADGTLTYTANPGYSGADSFTYEVSDGQGGVTVGTVHFQVSKPINQAPVVQNEFVTIVADTPVSAHESVLLGNDADPEGGPLTVQSLGQPANGTLVRAADGTLTYTPKPGFVGTDTFTYVVADAQGLTSTGTVTLQVNPNPNPPSLAAPTVTLLDDANNDGVISAAEAQPRVDLRIGLPQGAKAGDTLTLEDQNGQLVSHKLTADEVSAGAVRLDDVFATPADGLPLSVSAFITPASGPASPKGTDSAAVDTSGPGTPTVTLAIDANNDGVITRAELNGVTRADVRVDLPAGAAVGDELTVRDDAGNSVGRVLMAADLAAGTVSFVEAFALPASGASLVVTATLMDRFGNASPGGSVRALLDGNFNPVAVDDVGSVRAYAPGFDATAPQTTGNVLSNDTDPDGPAANLRVAGVATSASVAQGQNVGQVIEGQYGHLTVNADGSYIYVADKSAGLSAAVQDVFYYLPKDGGTAAAGANALAPAKLSITVDPAYQNVIQVLPPDAPALEGQYLVFGVQVTASPIPTTNSLAVLSGTAAAAVDITTPLQVNFGAGWVNVGGSAVSVPPNTTSYQVRILTVDDTQLEPTETIRLQVTSGSGSTAHADGSILDNDSARGQAFGTEDNALTLTWANFNLGDISNTTEKIIITSLPKDGLLQCYNGASPTVTVGQAISKADVDAGRLVFIPDANESGTDAYLAVGVGNLRADYAQFGFTAVDTKGQTYSGGTVTVDIAPTVDLGNLQVGVTGLAGSQISYNFTLFGSPSDTDGSERTRIAVQWLDKGMLVVDGATGATSAAVREANGLVLIDPDDRILLTRVSPGENTLVYAVVREEVGGAGEVLSSASSGYASISFFYPSTPLVLDLNADGVKTVGLEHGVAFDLNVDGRAEKTGWSDGKDGFLVLDRNSNGRIDNGAELFGDNTVLADGSKASDGFAALADLDGNGDGSINAQDALFASLQVWVDENTDGVSQAGELHGLADVSVAEIHLAHQASDRMHNGNLLGLIGSYTDTHGHAHDMVDVWFATEPATPPGQSPNGVLSVQDLLASSTSLDTVLHAANAEPLGPATDSPLPSPLEVNADLLSLQWHTGLHRVLMSEATMV